MEKIKEFFKFMIGLFIFTFLLFKIIGFLSKPHPDPVSVGDIWMYIPTEKDPFKKVEYNCYKVLEIKQGFVKYINLRYGWTSSSKISDFTYNAKKIR